MKKLIVIGSAVLVCFAGCAKKKTADVVIKVGGNEITKSQVLQVAEVFREQYVRLQPSKALEGMGSEILKGAARQLVANKVLCIEAGKLGIKADSARVNKAVDQLKKRVPDEAAFQRELTRMGETEQSLRKQISEGIMIDSLIKIVVVRADTVSTGECKEFFEKNKDRFIAMPSIRVSQILFPADTSLTSMERKQILDKARLALAEVKAGGDFVAAINKYAAKPGPASGGDIGWFKKGDMMPELEQVLFGMKKNQVSDLITTKVGYHILKVTDEKKGDPANFDKVKDQVRMTLEIQKRNQKVIGYMDSLISRADIVYVDTSYSPGKVLKTAAGVE